MVEVLLNVKILVCLPARYESQRFPGKVLADQTGKPLIQHTYERACQAQLPQEVLIATDHAKVQAAVEAFGGPCVMTQPEHPSGTDRIAEAVADKDADIVVNLQGDEPEIDPAHIDLVAQLLLDHPEIPMATLCAPLTSTEQIANPNIVKVVTTLCGRALMFSRSVLPYDRNAGGIGQTTPYYRHIGIYAYRKDFLSTLTKLPPSPLELTEKLEQLRVLENGHTIQVGRVDHVCDGIDTPEQYAAFVERMKQS